MTVSSAWAGGASKHRGHTDDRRHDGTTVFHAMVFHAANTTVVRIMSFFALYRALTPTST